MISTLPYKFHLQVPLYLNYCYLLKIFTIFIIVIAILLVIIANSVITINVVEVKS